jgi:hypothetical protein
MAKKAATAKAAKGNGSENGTKKVRWMSVEGQPDTFRSALGTIKQRATGWLLYKKGERKAAGTFKTKKAAQDAAVAA